MRKSWGAETGWETVCRRASGRRHYNATRQLQAKLRRAEVERLWVEAGCTYGAQARIARQLDVSEATISRDIQAIEQRWQHE